MPKKIDDIEVTLSAGKIFLTQNNNSVSFPVKRTRKILKGIEDEANNGSAHSEVAKQIFSYWCSVMDKDARAKFTPERRRAVLNRLREGYTPDEIYSAIRGCASSDWNMGQNPRGRPFNDIELICRDGKHVEDFIQMGRGRIETLKTRSVSDSLDDRSWAIGTQIPGVD